MCLRLMAFHGPPLANRVLPPDIVSKFSFQLRWITRNEEYKDLIAMTRRSVCSNQMLLNADIHAVYWAIYFI